MRTADDQYADLLDEILTTGETVTTRNSVCRRLFARTLVFTRTPLIVARKTAWRNALREMQWALSGSCNINHLHPSVRHWWMPWANREGNIWNTYGTQLRYFTEKSFDQIAYMSKGVAEHPFSRRNVITTWNTAEMADSDTPITNCWWTVLQAFVNPDNSLHLVTYQRSADTIVGLPANWIQSWAFLLWLAHQTGRKVGSLTWIGGDIHVYETHLDLARRIVEAGKGKHLEGPELVYGPDDDGSVFRADDFALTGPYNPVIEERAEMVV